MALPPLIQPSVAAQPTLDTAIWFLQLRWLAAAGQILTMAVVVWGFGIKLPERQLLALIGFTAATNITYWIWLNQLHRRGMQPSDKLPREQVISGLLLSDVVVLTGMLYISAGMANPFGLFYFVNIAVAGAMVSPAWAWAIWSTTVGGVTLLLFKSEPIDVLSAASLVAATPGNSDEGSPLWTIPKLGLWVSFATCSGVITFFITTLTGELRQREKALQDAEDDRLRARQLEGLATLATGAAHELATPMTTIAVVAKELSRALDKLEAPEAIRDDAKLIRAELDQCRSILDRMTSAAGDAAGERLETIGPSDFIEECLLGIRRRDRVQTEILSNSNAQTEAPSRKIRTGNLLPVQATAQAVRNLIQNALDSASDDSQVSVRLSTTESDWKIEIQDHGEGMDVAVLARIGEPFFTTKEPGRGTGLGLYLTENVIRRLSGQLSFESEPGKGTVAQVTLPTSRS
ncbi:MAG: sensor histidine kinase [Pirellulaceae bacterium]